MQKYAEEFDLAVFDSKHSRLLSKSGGVNYSSQEIIDLRYYLVEYLGEYSVKDCIQLLQVACDFNIVMTQELILSQARLSHKTESAFRLTLMETLNVLMNAEKKLVLYPANSKEYQLLASAIYYFLSILFIRSEELKIKNRQLYENVFSKTILKQVIDARKLRLLKED